MGTRNLQGICKKGWFYKLITYCWIRLLVSFFKWSMNWQKKVIRIPQIFVTNNYQIL